MRCPRLVPGLLALALSLPMASRAATITVTTTADTLTGPGCSLRAAITAANTNAAVGGCPAGSGAADTINLPAGTYTLTRTNAGGVNEDANSTGDLDINASLTLQGAGAATTIIQAGTSTADGIDKVIAVNPLCVTPINVIIDGVTIRYGRNTQPYGALDFSYTGGGIDICNAGTGNVTLSNSVVTGNTAVTGYGGGVNVDTVASTGTVTLRNTVIQGNATATTTSTGTGGGVNVYGDAVNVVIDGCTIDGNSTAGSQAGGGLHYRPTNGGSLRVHATTIRGNAAGGLGGGIGIVPFAAVVVVEIDQGTRVEDNLSGGGGSTSGGGGVLVDGTLTTTPVRLSGVTITGNAEAPSASPHLGGGGILVGQGNVTVEYSRIAGNTTLLAAAGSGLHKEITAGTVTATNDWWGCSAGPAAGACDRAVIAAGSAGSLSTVPYLRVTTTASPASLAVGETSLVTASFASNSSGADVSTHLSALVGVPIAWAPVGGDVSGEQTELQASGTATATYTATAAGAGNRVAAVVDADSLSSGSNVRSLTVTSPAADLALTLTDTPDPVAAGASITYTLTAGNAGPNAASAVTLSDTLPAGLSIVSFTGPAGWTTSVVGTTATATRDSFASGGTAQFTLVAQVGAGVAAGTLSNTASVGAGTSDPSPANNTSTTSTTVQPRADLSVTLADVADPVTAGGALGYALGIASAGPSVARNVAVTVALPAGVVLSSVTPTAGTGWTSSPSGSTLTLSKASVAPGETASFSLALEVPASRRAALSATATAASDAADPQPANDTATATTAVQARADLAVAASAPAQVHPDQDLSYTLSVTDQGPSDASAVLLQASLPSGTTFVSLSVPGGWSATTPAVGAGGSIQVAATALDAGAAAQCTLVVHVPASAVHGSVLSLTASAAATESDPVAANDAATATTTVQASADLAVTLAAAPAPVLAGGQLTYTIGFTSGGPHGAAGVAVTLPVPAGTTFVSAAVASGEGWTPSTPAAGGTGDVTFARTAVPSGAAATFTVVVATGAGAGGSTVDAQAAVTSSTPDPAAGNDTAAASTAVTAHAADLAVALAAAPDPIAPGAQLTYTLSFTADGPQPAADVTVTLPVPAGTTFVSAAVTSGDGWTPATPAAGATGDVTFARAAAPAGAAATFTVVVAVDAAAVDGSTIEALATVVSATADPDAADDQAGASTAVAAGPQPPASSSSGCGCGAGGGGEVGLLGLLLVGVLRRRRRVR